MRGYKATDKDMRCRGYQFELGKWFEHEGDLALCESGFHFCAQPSGPWVYYPDPTTRIFEIEAEEVLDAPAQPGADYKLVCRRIKLVKEITPPKDSHHNTGYCNTGHCNTGDGNTGDYNTGDGNTGDYNTGNGNTSNHNTGYCNTGHYNTGYCNTGHCNTGYCNTGSYNATNYSSGFFCADEPTIISFDTPTALAREDYLTKYPEVNDLGSALMRDEPIEFKQFKNIPGITEGKLKALHEKFIAARKKETSERTDKY